jgi:hypothetical protein
MLLVPTIKRDRRLFLDAYSYQEGELNAVGKSLEEYGIRSEVEALEPDSSDRTGRRYIIPREDVPKLEERLSIRFRGEDEQTTTEIYPPGKGYKCEEITLRGHGSGCVDFSANDRTEATVKCALIAHNKGWFGGVASSGNCKSHLSRLFLRR